MFRFRFPFTSFFLSSQIDFCTCKCEHHRTKDKENRKMPRVLNTGSYLRFVRQTVRFPTGSVSHRFGSVREYEWLRFGSYVAGSFRDSVLELDWKFSHLFNIFNTSLLPISRFFLITKASCQAWRSCSLRTK